MNTVVQVRDLLAFFNGMVRAAGGRGMSRLDRRRYEFSFRKRGKGWTK